MLGLLLSAACHPHLASRILPAKGCHPELSTISSTFLDLVTVSHKLASLSPCKASGHDDMSNRLLKECATGLAEPLCHIFNLSISSGVYPQCWKKAVIQPVYKRKGERTCPQSYRPIALLPCVSKVFERLVGEQLLRHTVAAKALPDEQFGVLPGRSTI